MVLDTAAVFTDKNGTVPENAQKAIAAIPKDILEEATKNRRARLPWSGKSLADMAAAIEVSGHRTAYAIMSWPAHARFAGQGIERIQHPTGDVEWRFGTTATPHDFEAVANHTRRTMHRMYFAVTRDFYGVTLPLATRTPFSGDETPEGT
jgi:hypothetical protein